VTLGYGRKELLEHRQTVQLVHQDPDDQLFSADVRQDVSFGPMNLGLPLAQVRDRVDGALTLLGITELADRPIHHLSFGQRKRVAIAGAVALRPAVILLDEPTAGLDPRGVASMHQALASLENAGTTVVLSTHDVDFAWSWADDVALVNDRSVTQGQTSTMLADPALVQASDLQLPWLVALLRELGVEAFPGRTPRTVTDVADVLSHLASRSAPTRIDDTDP
jgi:cobalt/nickel transport system ATP-binding protein